MTREDVLALDIERAIANYVGVDEFTGSDFPEVAKSFAAVIRSTHVSNGFPGHRLGPLEAGARAQALIHSLSDLLSKLAVITE